jgi:hypothetical protein
MVVYWIFVILYLSKTRNSIFNAKCHGLFYVNCSGEWRLLILLKLVKLLQWYSWNIVESGVEHHNPNPESLSSQQFHQFQQNQQLYLSYLSPGVVRLLFYCQVLSHTISCNNILQYAVNLLWKKDKPQIIFIVLIIDSSTPLICSPWPTEVIVINVCHHIHLLVGDFSIWHLKYHWTNWNQIWHMVLRWLTTFCMILVSFGNSTFTYMAAILNMLSVLKNIPQANRTCGFDHH